MDRHVRSITKRLKRVEYTGHRSSEVFRHWLTLTEASLEELPSQIPHLAKGHIGEDSPEHQQLWKEMRDRYPRPDVWTLFAECLGILLESTDTNGHQHVGGEVVMKDRGKPSYDDVLGDVYMDYAYPNPGTGQYFTPWQICMLMAGITIDNGEREVQDRVKEALLSAEGIEGALATATLFTSVLAKEPEEAFRYYLERVIPTAVTCGYEPIKIMDPCVGSGRMLLAMASQFPGWATSLGLVQFYGQDIDPVCVQMTNVNMMLYGLNGAYMKNLLEGSGWDGIPTPPPEMIEAAKEANDNGDGKKVAEIAAQFRGRDYQQMGLFSMEDTDEKANED